MNLVLIVANAEYKKFRVEYHSGAAAALKSLKKIKVVNPWQNISVNI